jgi:hypothetical protein
VVFKPAVLLGITNRALDNQAAWHVQREATAVLVV